MMRTMMRTMARDMTRSEVTKRIKAALRQRSGRPWSITGGRGTAWGWLTITAPKARLTAYGEMSQVCRKGLGNENEN